MAQAPRDGNRIPALLGTSNADGITPLPVYVDAATNRLLVNASVTVSGLPTAVTDGEAVDVADTGNLALGTDGSNYQILKTDSNGELQIDVLSSALPSGAATSAKQDTIIGHVDGIEGLLTTIDGDTGNISTKIDTLAGAVSGTEVQVDVLTMPTVTVNSHAVTNAGTFAVQVDGAALTSLQLIDDPVVTLGTTTYTEASSKGMTVGAVRRDADTTLVDTTNEFGPLQMDANGRLKVEAFSGETLPVSLASTTVTGTVAVTQSGTWDEVGINDSGNSITVDQATGSNLHTVVDSGTITTVSAVTAITNALPAGTNAIGKLAANSGVDIGDVDVTSLPAIPSGSNIIGRVGHDITGIATGRTTVTTAGTRVVLAASTTCKRVVITAETDNTGLIVVGGTGVVAALATRQGTPLYPGDSIELEIDNLNDINIDSTISTDGVTYSYFT